jgi:hypothetical protein
MSDFLAVGGVSAVLKWVMSNDLSSAGLHTALGTSAGISALAPDRIPTGATEQPTLNLFMYYASLNGAYRNADLPSRDDQNRRLTNPPLPLDLHYLVSAYGKNEFDSEILLAWAMQWFHENPVIARSTIQNSLAAMLGGSPSSEVQAIAATTLASQFELLKITPEALSNEEISKLWMAFSTHYRPTASYQVSVVLIQETQPVKSNLPVQFRNVMALPLQTPTIDSLVPNIIGSNEVLTIAGRNFIGDAASDTLVAFDNNPPITPDTVGPTVIRITTPSSLPAGVHMVRVVRNVDFGVVTDPHPGFSSIPVPFLLVPTITDASPLSATVGTSFTVKLLPAVERTQRATLFIGDYGVEIDARPASDPPTSDSLVFPLPADAPHPVTVPVRVQVDTAQSRLSQDTTTGSPTFGQFLPQIKVAP